MIRTKWYRFSTEQKDQMKKDVLSILARVINYKLNYKKYYYKLILLKTI